MPITTTVAVELEVLAALVSLLTGSSDLLNSGIVQGTGASRTVKVFNQVTQDAANPYVRVTITDTLPMDAEPFEYSYTPKAAKVHAMIDVFSDYSVESMNIANVVKNLVQHTELTTPNFHGNTWLLSIDHVEDNTSQPDYVYYQSSLRIEARMLLLT